jgi:hypothetical protein
MAYRRIGVWACRRIGEAVGRNTTKEREPVLSEKEPPLNYRR